MQTGDAIDPLDSLRLAGRLENGVGDVDDTVVAQVQYRQVFKLEHADWPSTDSGVFQGQVDQLRHRRNSGWLTKRVVVQVQQLQPRQSRKYRAHRLVHHQTVALQLQLGQTLQLSQRIGKPGQAIIAEVEPAQPGEHLQKPRRHRLQVHA
ncbi:hypothetical protein D3C72_1981170 [compost metagenome]